MKRMKCSYTAEYFQAMFYVAGIVLLTSLGLIYSCIHQHSYIYIGVGIVGLIFGIIGLMEVAKKKKIFPHGSFHLLREIIALILLALAVFILRFNSVLHPSLQSGINWRERMVIIILFVLGIHALHLRGYLKPEEKK